MGFRKGPIAENVTWHLNRSFGDMRALPNSFGLKGASAFPSSVTLAIGRIDAALSTTCAEHVAREDRSGFGSHRKRCGTNTTT
jgi:hypothetical protein